VAARLVLGALEEETAFVDFDVDCNVDIILSYDWLRAHGLTFLYDADEVCFCAERGCTSGRSVRLDLTLAAQTSPATRLSATDGGTGSLLACRLGCGFPRLAARRSGSLPQAARPLLLPSRRPPGWTTRWRASTCLYYDHDNEASKCVAGLANTCTTLPDGTKLFVGSITFAAEGPAFSLPPDAGDPPDFAELAAEYGDILAGPPPGVPPDRGPAFELRIDTGSHPMPRSQSAGRRASLTSAANRWPFCSIMAFLLDHGWNVPSSASHAALVVFARKQDGTWRFCQDYGELNAITQRSVEPLLHVDQLVDETRGAHFFTKLYLAMAYMQFCIREEDQFKTSFRVPRGQYEFRVGAFGLHAAAVHGHALHGMSSVLVRYMHSIFGRPALSFDSAGRTAPRGRVPVPRSHLCWGALCRYTAMTSSSSPKRARST
jgi:hypothetical protein